MIDDELSFFVLSYYLIYDDKLLKPRIIKDDYIAIDYGEEEYYLYPLIS